MTADKNKHRPLQKLRSYFSMTPEEYIDEQLNQFREWYDKKGYVCINS
ncbi:hypothetical protein [Nitrosomonas mobilis]|nr:hypothetical protein [Nitrosomonas mobilis]